MKQAEAEFNADQADQASIKKEELLPNINLQRAKEKQELENQEGKKSESISKMPKTVEAREKKKVA